MDNRNSFPSTPRTNQYRDRLPALADPNPKILARKGGKFSRLLEQSGAAEPSIRKDALGRFPKPFTMRQALAAKPSRMAIRKRPDVLCK